MVDPIANRPLTRADVRGICESPDMCFVGDEFTWVRCGPCADEFYKRRINYHENSHRPQEHPQAPERPQGLRPSPLPPVPPRNDSGWHQGFHSCEQG